MTAASASQKRRQLRISTIGKSQSRWAISLITFVDNFQGEESDIVIASLTRSNKHGEIGFMSAPQRLNVLLSRARDGLIIVGDAKTFKHSKKGSKIWTPFFQQLIQSGHFFDGLPIKCQQHPTNATVLTRPEDFDVHCPGGGCRLPW